MTAQFMVAYLVSSVTARRLVGLLVTAILAWLILASPSLVSAFSGLGGYISEKALGDGVNEALHLGDGTNQLSVLGSGPAVATLTASGVSMAGGGTATLRGNLSNLNGMPQADTWFVWGYSPSAMTNTTATTVALATGVQTVTITGFNTKQDVYYQFRASTDAISSGTTVSFIADTGFSFLNTMLPILIALAILVFVMITTGNPLIALLGSLIGIIAFYVVQAMLQMLT